MKDIFVARQPIFDKRQRVVGYELLYRADGDSEGAFDVNDKTMTSSVLVNGVLGVGLSRLTEGQTAYINVSQEMLFDGTVELLDPRAVVVELLESIEPSQAVIERCRALVADGYRFAMDDFQWNDAFIPLLEVADIVKIDVVASAGDTARLVELVKPHKVRLLAEKVETKEVHEQCVQEGFEMFQGYHYFRPQTVSTRDTSAQSVSIIRLMNMLRDAAASDRSLEEAFKSDPSLTYKLLRIVNSAALGGRGVQSIPHALRLLGRDPLYRWLCLLLVSMGRGGGDVRVEIVKAALLRARMCEVLGETMRTSTRDIPSSGALFLVGLFAQIDQLVGTPLSEILSEIDVTPDVRAALLEREGNAGMILKSAEAYAEADWGGAEEQIAAAGGDPDVLPSVYVDAVTWASERVLLNVR